MKKMLAYFFLLIGLTLNAQSTSFFEEFNRARKNIESFSYTGRMMLKKFGHDQFATRKFQVFGLKNGLNTGYNFDWEIIEYTSTRNVSMLFKEDEFYFTNKITKLSAHELNVEKLEIGSYPETMREGLIFDELIYGVNSSSLGKSFEVIRGQDSTLVQVKVNEQATRRIVFDKNYFPRRLIVSISDTSMKDQQILDIRLENIKINQELPDSVVSPKWVRENGYYINYPENAVAKVTDMPSDSEIVDHLFQHNFINDKENIVSLKTQKHKLIMLDFWYASCLPCLNGIPKIQKLSDEYGSKGLKVLGINCFDNVEKKKLTEKLKKLGV